MKIKPFLQSGYQLLQDGVVALSKVEATGIRIDVRKLESTQAELLRKSEELRRRIKENEVWRIWRKRYGAKAILTSRMQLAGVLHLEMGYQVSNETEKGRPSTDEEALRKIDHPFIDEYIRFLRYEKLLGTYLKGIQEELDGDRIHPTFNLHTARTYRSSSDSPNFQNLPIRDEESAKIIRSLFIPSPGCVLVENDFKGIEVVLSASYHRDPVFIDFIRSPGKDMHREMAAQLYCLKPEEVSKEARYGAKNKFVFPQFYGDFYVSCARALWEWIEKGKLKTPEGLSLYRHLRKKGIKELGLCDPEVRPQPGTFEYHVKKVEDDFWNRRFKRYGEWRKEWFNRYLERGYFDLLTGFRIFGSFPRNAVVNYPVQGSAFHCLLWSLIQVVKVPFRRSRVVGQIHDSLIGDVAENELRDYLATVEDVTRNQLPKHWPWLAVEPETEYELCLPGKSWYDKQKVSFRGGRFICPQDPRRSTLNSKLFLSALQDEKNKDIA